MFALHFNQNSPYQVTLPRLARKQDIITLAQAFTRREAALAARDRTPVYEAMAAILTEAEAAQLAAFASENARKEASESVKELDRAAQKTARQVRDLLAYRFAESPVLAQQWGLTVHQTGRSAGRILLPANRNERLAFLDAYIRKESSQPAEAQFSNPDLSEVTALRDNLKAQLLARQEASQQRKQSNARLTALCEDLRSELRRGLGYLVVVRYDGELDRELEQWGFRITARTPDHSGDLPPEEEGAAGDMTAVTTSLHEVPAANGHAVTNGTMALA